jgi:hypothetical protein
MVGFSGQSLPILAPLPTIDVLWSDLHMNARGQISDWVVGNLESSTNFGGYPVIGT